MSGEPITSGWFDDISSRVSYLEDALLWSKVSSSTRYIDNRIVDWNEETATSTLLQSGVSELSAPQNSGGGFRWTKTVNMSEMFLKPPRVFTNPRIIDMRTAGSLSSYAKQINKDSFSVEVFYMPAATRQGIPSSPELVVDWLAIGYASE